MKTYIDKKIILISALLLVVVLILLATTNERACFWLVENGEAGICYEKPRFFNSDKGVKKRYSELTSKIQKSSEELNELIYFSNELKEAYGESRFESVKEAFLWIEEESLSYIVEGSDFSALLLDKEKEDSYALIFDNNKSKFIFSYDMKQYYEPIVTGWVNRLYFGRLNVDTTYFWFEYGDKRCVFKKANVVLYSKKMTILENKGVVCDFGKYQLTKTKENNHVGRRVLNEAIENRNVMDITMKFIEWISN